jgi:hypothetical protein
VPEAAPPGSHCNGPSPSHEPGAHYLDHLLDGKAVGDHQPPARRARRLASNSSRSSAAAQGACAGGLAIVSCVPDDGVDEPLAMYPCGQRLGERRRRGEREHEGKGRFHWFDLCLGHYWDTAAVRH